jgi:hypothetical protein
MSLKFWNNIFNGKHMLFVTKSLRNTNTNLRQLAHIDAGYCYYSLSLKLWQEFAK